MTKRNFIFCFMLTVFLTDLKAQTIDAQLMKLSDASNDSIVHQPDTSLISYDNALLQWETISDVNIWMKNNFHYDFERANELSENSSTREKTNIYTPLELYQTKKGVCIDLSRFAVETINILDTSIHIQYLMIEFEPIIINGGIIRKHWMAVYQDSLGYYLLADSKRPGYIAGPYKNVDKFIDNYQIFRERKIVSWKILSSYKKTRKKKTIKQKQK